MPFISGIYSSVGKHHIKYSGEYTIMHNTMTFWQPGEPYFLLRRGGLPRHDRAAETAAGAVSPPPVPRETRPDDPGAFVYAA